MLIYYFKQLLEIWVWSGYILFVTVDVSEVVDIC